MISPGEKILIAGDSWALGEWSVDDPYRIVHSGLEKYLIDYGCKVYNVSKGGNSNRYSINTLKQLIKGIEFDIDKIFWFQTDPMRDLRPYTTFPKTLKKYMEYHSVLLDTSYKLLNSLGVTIYCIGGTTKLHDSIRSYSNLIPVIDSVIELFEVDSIDIWVSDWIQYDLNIDEEFLKLLTELPDPKSILPKEWFYPDGIHPNRHAHKKIFEHILTC